MIRKINTNLNFDPAGAKSVYYNRQREHRRDSMSIDVGTHLKAVRQMYGLSQRELAKRAGVTNGLISLIEQNRVSPSVSSLKKVLDGIPMALADFFTLDLGGKPQVFSPAKSSRISAQPAWSCAWSEADWPNAACRSCTSATGPMRTPAKKC